jgi:hypothetical protein
MIGGKEKNLPKKVKERHKSRKKKENSQKEIP